MKIIQLIYSLRSGGAEKFVVNLSNEFVKQGHEVTVCILLNENIDNLVFNKQFLDSKVKFVSLNSNSGFNIRKIYLVESFIKKQNPDIVNCHLNVIPYIFRLALCNRSIKFVHTLHSIASKASGFKIQYYFNKYLYKNNIIQPVTISQECNQSFIKYYHLNNAICIDNGCTPIIPSERFPKVYSEVNKYKMRSDTPVFIHVARCHPAKNQELLIKAFNQLNSDKIDFVLLVVGNGFFDEHNTKYVHSACDKIYFLGEKANVGDYLLCADAICLSSIYEGLPISLIEAMSCGLASICTPVGGINDVVIDGVTGFLSKNLTKESYVETIKKFLNSRLESPVIVNEYQKRFSMEKCASKYLFLYNELTNDAKSLNNQKITFN